MKTYVTVDRDKFIQIMSNHANKCVKEIDRVRTCKSAEILVDNVGCFEGIDSSKLTSHYKTTRLQEIIQECQERREAAKGFPIDALFSFSLTRDFYHEH